MIRSAFGFGVLMSCLFFTLPANAVNCPANAEPYGAGLCRCIGNYIENRGRCVVFDIGSAKVRALELKAIERTDCAAMSQIVNEFARATNFNGEQLASYAGKVLSNGIEFYYHGISVTLVAPVEPHYAVPFGDSGFRDAYRDGSNQVRHFAGYFAAGLHYNAETMTAIMAELRDRGEPPDIALGNLAAALGRQMAGVPHMMENVGQAVRSQVCQ